MSKIIGEYVTVSASEANLAFSPSTYLTDGDVLIDEEGHIGVLGSSEDDSGAYTMTTVGSQGITWDKIDERPDVPFAVIENLTHTTDGVVVNARVHDISGKVTNANMKTDSIKNLFRFQASGTLDNGTTKNGILSSPVSIIPINDEEDPLCNYIVQANYNGSFSNPNQISTIYFKYGPRSSNGVGDDIATYNINDVVRWDNVVNKPEYVIGTLSLIGKDRIHANVINNTNQRQTVKVYWLIDGEDSVSDSGIQWTLWPKNKHSYEETLIPPTGKTLDDIKWIALLAVEANQYVDYVDIRPVTT